MELKIISFNANGLRSRLTLLGDLLAETKADVLLVQETLLHERSRANIRGYQHYKSPRGPDCRGLSTYVRHGLNHAQHLQPRTEQVEAQALEVRLQTGGLVVVNAYRSPASDDLHAPDLDSLLQAGSQVLITGDLNCKHATWNDSPGNRAGTELYTLSTRRDFLIIAPDTPTRTDPKTGQQSTLDIAIAKGVGHLITASTLDCLGSDHAPVLFTVHTPPRLTPATPRPDYNRARWPAFRRHLEDNLKIHRFNSIQEIDEGVSTLTSTIQHAISTCIPKTKNRTQPDTLPQELSDLKKRKNAAKRRWHRTNREEDRAAHKFLQNHLQTGISAWREKKWHNTLESCNQDHTQVWLVAALVACCAAVPAPAPSSVHDQGGHQGGHHARPAPAFRCSGRRYWSVQQQTCVDCTRCQEVTIRPCDGHRDAQCGPLSDLKIDWSWLRTAPALPDRKKHGGVHERINSLSEAEALLRDELKHMPGSGPRRDRIVDFGDDFILPEHPRQPSQPHKKEKKSRKNKKAHTAKPFGDYDDFADFGASGDAVGDPVSDDEDIAQAVWRRNHHHRAGSREPSIAASTPASTAAPTTTTTSTTTPRPHTVSLVEDFIVVKEEQEVVPEAEAAPGQRADLDVVATTQTFTTAETLVWDWQAGVLVAAVCACLLFFIVAAAYSCQHAWHFKKLKKNLDAGKDPSPTPIVHLALGDMEEISARLALMSGMGAEHFQDTGVASNGSVMNEKTAAFPVRRGNGPRLAL
ncbi:putative RNA-directed DNA polymerase from transposon BS [Frankliniella fusca]|uniref:RNA-directed DNA polymerase from transposon BS n=1 Tax=Frankliniella fusca TaxID=407009 RepID=A0AAE1LA08_9NEOP|nr:putative RNA-directed DNA polymerase from transposon BS [Frankliniella fusca]